MSETQFYGMDELCPTCHQPKKGPAWNIYCENFHAVHWGTGMYKDQQTAPQASEGDSADRRQPDPQIVGADASGHASPMRSGEQSTAKVSQDTADRYSPESPMPQATEVEPLRAAARKVLDDSRCVGAHTLDILPDMLVKKHVLDELAAALDRMGTGK